MHLFEQQSSGLVASRFQSYHAADGEMCDRLKHPRQSSCHSFYVRIELVIGTASHFRERPERILGPPE